jgi:hypothetical protein
MSEPSPSEYTLLMALSAFYTGPTDINHPALPCFKEITMAKRLLVMLSVLFAPATILAQTTLFGGVSGQDGEVEIVTIDQANGTGTLVGEFATAEDYLELDGLAFDSAGRLFAATTESVGQPNAVTLIRIDPLTGKQVALIGTMDPHVYGLAIQPGTDVLFGIAWNFSTDTSDLYIIDKITALATFVGNTGVTGLTLAFGPDGTLYLISWEGFVTGFLHTLDPTTAAVLTTSAPLADIPRALAVRPTDGVIFASGNGIYTLSTEGVLTLVGNTGWFPGLGGLAFTPVPTDKSQCKNWGWRINFPFAFKNQGDCMQFVNTGK